jgi:hypothetical protein
MFNNLSKKNKKKFINFALIKMPLGIIIGIMLILIFNKYTDINYFKGRLLLLILILIFCYIYTLSRYYQQLLNDEKGNSD